MKTIIKQEFKNYLKRPLFWVGILIVILGIYQMLTPYFNIHYFSPETKIPDIPIENASAIVDADIQDGYIMSTKEEQLQLGLEEIKKQFIEFFEISKEEAEKIIDEIKSKELSIPEIVEYLETTYNFYNSDYTFDIFEYHKGSAEEVNAFIDAKLQEHPFSYYFARKFADACGLFMGFFATIILAFLFTSDTRKDMYELLHTKQISSKYYILGKVGGGLSVILFVLGILVILFGLLSEIHGNKIGVSIYFWDFILVTTIYILPNMLMIICVYAIIALLFKNPLPATPLLILYMVYSNMGSIGSDGKYGYYGRALAIMVRFPGKFFDVAPPPMAFINQLCLLGASVVLIILCIILWKRRRVY